MMHYHFNDGYQLVITISIFTLLCSSIDTFIVTVVCCKVTQVVLVISLVIIVKQSVLMVIIVAMLIATGVIVSTQEGN